MTLERSVVDPIHKAAEMLAEALEEFGMAFDEETVKILRAEVKDNPTIIGALDFLDGKKSLNFSSLERLSKKLKDAARDLYGEGEE